VGCDSSVDIVTRYRMDGSGIESRWVAKLPAPVQTGTRAHSASYTKGTGSKTVNTVTFFVVCSNYMFRHAWAIFRLKYCTKTH
jgi:hypothetical protein